MTPEFSRKPMFGLTPVALITRSASSAAAPLGQRAPRSGAHRASIASTRVPVYTARPWLSHQSLIMPPAVGPIMRGTMRSPISTTVSLHAARGQRLHDDAADEAGAHLQHARARLGRQLRMMARASSSVQQGCTPGPSMPGIGGVAGARAGGDQQAVEGAACCRRRARRCACADVDAARRGRAAASMRSCCEVVGGRGAGACRPRRCCPISRYGIAMREYGGSGSSPTMHDLVVRRVLADAFRRRSRRPGRRRGSRVSWLLSSLKGSKAVRANRLRVTPRRTRRLQAQARARLGLERAVGCPSRAPRSTSAASRAAC